MVYLACYYSQVDKNKKMEREREKLREILKYCLKNPADLDKIRIVEEDGEYWVEWEE